MIIILLNLKNRILNNLIGNKYKFFKLIYKLSLKNYILLLIII